MVKDTSEEDDEVRFVYCECEKIPSNHPIRCTSQLEIHHIERITGPDDQPPFVLFSGGALGAQRSWGRVQLCKSVESSF